MLSRNQTRKGGSKRGRSDEWAADTRDTDSLQNTAFEVYYKHSGIVSESEWMMFMNCLRTSLPMALRINSSSSHSDMINRYVEDLLSSVTRVTRISFFPSHKAMQCDLSRGDLKRNLELKSIKKMVAALNEGGFLTRQEAVSMLPPLLLQINPGHHVLDLCAAPGSKTSQILEALLPEADTGVVVANDVNASRLDILYHQSNRLTGAHPHLIITNYDATRFPLLPSESKFDRVLCDIMCSGDGTLRKSVDMWHRWNTLKGADLHMIQTRVLMRGMALCKKGGIVVYSTCSLNPVEDEAVVSESLHMANGAFRLIDPTRLLPNLKASPGLTAWRLTSKDLTATFRTYEEAKTFGEAEPKRKGFQYKASMFANTERLRAQNIQYTRRILPHTQDTGGFFVAVMECVEELDANVSPASGGVVGDGGSAPMGSLPDAMRICIQDAFHLPSSFPYEQLLCRTETSREPKIYYANAPTIALSTKLGSRVVQVGSKIFEAYAKYSHTKLRFCADGASTLASLLPKDFVFDVRPQLFLELGMAVLLGVEAFASRLGRAVGELPTSCFLLSTTTELVGTLYAVVGRSENLGNIAVRAKEWQLTLCRKELGLPLIPPSDTNNLLCD